MLTKLLFLLVFFALSVTSLPTLSNPNSKSIRIPLQQHTTHKNVLMEKQAKKVKKFGKEEMRSWSRYDPRLLEAPYRSRFEILVEGI
jgi:hypothetical protein